MYKTLNFAGGLEKGRVCPSSSGNALKTSLLPPRMILHFHSFLLIHFMATAMGGAKAKPAELIELFSGSEFACPDIEVIAVGNQVITPVACL